LGLLSLFALRDILVDLHELRFEDNPVGLETREHVDEVRLRICGSGFPISRPTRRRRLARGGGGGDNAWGGGAAAHAAQQPFRVFSGVAGRMPCACWAAARRRSHWEGEEMLCMGWNSRNSRGLRGGFLCSQAFHWAGQASVREVNAPATFLVRGV
jgi:hypothetical protein